MFGFLIEVNIRQVRDCYAMWLILRVKGGKCRSGAIVLPYMHILFIGGDKMIGWGAGAKPLRYSMVCSGYRGTFII